MDGIYIVGVGMTQFGKFPETAMKDLARKAINDALTDANCRKEAVEAAFFANATMGYMEGQTFIPGPIALNYAGFEGIPMMTVENACGSGSTAMWLAINFLRSGAGDVALAVGAEKMNIPDKAKAMRVFDSGWELATAEEHFRHMMEVCGADVPEGTTGTGPRSYFMDVYAANARYQMTHSGLTQYQMAVVSAKNHMNSVNNPRAAYRKAFTAEEIMAAKPVVYPLTVPMCAPLTDGGAAVIFCNEAGMKRYGFDRSRAVKVDACILRGATNHTYEESSARMADVLCAREAYDEAGMGPEDIDVAEVHDATSLGEISAVEHLGFCGCGEGGAFCESGETALTGSIPINPSGGLESKGHPLGATGPGQIFELVSQLRGECGVRQVEGARVALQQNGGGQIKDDSASMVVTILSKCQ